MSDSNGEKLEIMADLTEDQKRLLSETLSQMETALFLRTLRKLKIYIALTLGILTVFGAFSITGIRSAVIDKAAEMISSNQEIKKQVKEDIVKKIESASELVQKSRELITSMDTENARLTATLPIKLDEIHEMISQIKEDLKKLKTNTDGT